MFPSYGTTDSIARYWGLIILIMVGFCMLAYFIVPLFIRVEENATSQFNGKGIKALPSALIYAYIQTGLSEEIMFRGFLGKRFIEKFKFSLGNLMQAFLFGLMHGILMFQVTGMLGAIVLALLTGTIGWFEGYLNEKQSGGSILTG